MIYFAFAKCFGAATLLYASLLSELDAKPDLSGLREGDHCRYNCCIDKPNSGRLLCVLSKLGRMVESSRCSAEHRGSKASIDIYCFIFFINAGKNIFYCELSFNSVDYN